MITVAELRSRFDYDPETGLLSRRQWEGRGHPGPTTGYPHPRGHRMLRIDGVKYLYQRLVWLHVHGVWPARLNHKDDAHANNRIGNLREADRSQQNFNARVGKRNSSGVKGVCWDRKNQKWMASLAVRGRSVHVGRFARKEDAQAAIEARRLELHGEFARHA